MYTIQVRPASGQELAKQQSPQINSSKVGSGRPHQSNHSLPVRSFNSPISLAFTILAGLLCIFASGCGGVVMGKTSIGPSKSLGTAVLNQVSCGTASLTGAQSKGCSVYLSVVASKSTVVSLSSNNAAAKVPASVTVLAGAMSTGFDVAASSVKTAQTATITATVGGVSKSLSIKLYPAAAASLSAISCGTTSLTGAGTKGCSVYVDSAAESSIVVSLSSNNAAVTVPKTVTIPAGAMSAGFGATSTAVSTTQSVTLTASANGVVQTDTMQLLGTTTSNPPPTQHEVQLSWSAPNSTATISGYEIYRATGSSGSFQLLNSSLDQQTVYSDMAVAGGTTYSYQVRSVDASGTVSTPSNTTTVTIPN
jgi:hypothetical protein